MNKRQKAKKIVLCVENKKLNAKTAKSLKKRIISNLEKNRMIVELDFSNVHKIDASGIAQLLISYRKVNEVEGKLRIINVKSERIETLIKLLHLDRIFEVRFN